MNNILDMLDNYINEDDQDTLMEDILDFLSLIDFNRLNEDQINKLDVILDHIDDYELNEKTKRVVRNKKKVRKKVCKSGYKAVDGKCVKMDAAERRKRSKGSKRGAKKKRGQKTSIRRKKAKSMKKR